MAARLSSQGVATTDAGSTSFLLTFREFLPGIFGTSSHAQQIAIVPTGGLAQENFEIDRTTFQLLVRGYASTEGTSTGLEQKVTDAINALNLVSGTINGHRYADIQKQGDPLYLGRDDNRRPVYSQNFLAWRSQTT